MPKLLDTLGFKDNPFANYVAENEPNIEQYFVRPPYFDAVATRGQARRSLVIFGARGAGKSATRLTFYKDCWTKRQKDEPAPLAVALDDFSRIAATGLANVELGKFVAEVGYLTVEAVLLWLAALDDEERKLQLETMTSEQEALVIALVDRFYMSRPELVRSASVREPLKLLNQAWHKRTKLWVEKRWDAVAGLISSIGAALAKRATDTDDQIDAGLRELLKSNPSQWSEGQYARALLSRFAAFAKAFGFTGVVVLVDKVDETPNTNNSANATANLLFPLLSTTQLLEVEDFAWLFFLWDKVKDGFSGNEQAVRLDKIAHATIQWQDSFLRSLVGKRLDYFSTGAITAFNQLCDQSMLADHAIGEIIQLCMRSPRELIRVLDATVREHDELYGTSGIHSLLMQDSVDRALDKYTVETLPRLYSKMPLQQISRLSLGAFSNRDIQTTFRINEGSARNRIRGWEDAGMVAKSGTRPAEGGQAGKPANEYSVVDQRIRRLLQRQLSLGPEFETVEDEEPST